MHLESRAGAAVASWRLFMRLEAIDGRDQDVRLPQVRNSWTTAIGKAPVNYPAH